MRRDRRDRAWGRGTDHPGLDPHLGTNKRPQLCGWGHLARWGNDHHQSFARTDQGTGRLSPRLGIGGLVTLFHVWIQKCSRPAIQPRLHADLHLLWTMDVLEEVAASKSGERCGTIEDLGKAI